MGDRFGPLLDGIASAIAADDAQLLLELSATLAETAGRWPAEALASGVEGRLAELVRQAEERRTAVVRELRRIEGALSHQADRKSLATE